MADPVEGLRASLADRYVIERELGRGGMATVYLAQDLKHDRLVAVKVFRRELASSLGAKRFLREIKITAKLSHPHILPLYDSGKADGFLYYVMPYIEGDSLRDLLSREQLLPLDGAIQIAREVAEALSYAHSYDVVHRDIKPANIMLSAGHAVVSDFGIARAINAAGGEKLTKTGMTIGTSAYMSPEQGVGTEHLTSRTDIYSLGCVLYEMLVGQTPFTGPTAMAIMARHSADDVPKPHIMRQTIPNELEEAILRALAKAPGDRFGTATEFADALAAVDTGATAKRRARRAAAPGQVRRWPVLAILRERRFLQFLGLYAITGFVALAAVDQLVGRAILPGLVYTLTLILYLAGFPASLIFAWFRGQKGPGRGLSGRLARGHRRSGPPQ